MELEDKRKTIGVLLICILLILSSAMLVRGYITPHERYGVSSMDGSSLMDGYTISAWIVGEQFGSNDTYNGDGSFVIDTQGDDDSQTICKYGGLNGDEITYWLDSNGDGMPDMIANQNDVFESGDIIYGNLDFYSSAQPNMDVKINELVPSPSSGNDYIYIYTPSGNISSADWRLENHDGFSASLDTLTTQYNPSATNMLAVDLGGDVLDAAGDELMLSWNPGTTGINGNNWVVMDRVEYGNQDVKPDNTTLEDYPYGVSTGQGLKRITNGSDTNDCSIDFSVGTATPFPGGIVPPTIMITQPDGGEVWKVGSNHNITWETSSGNGTITGVDLQYSTDSGSTWTDIVTGTSDDGLYQWTIPDDPSVNCLVKGIVHDDQPASSSDTSNDTFEISSTVSPSITITYPNGGEQFEVGTQEDITWTSNSGDGTITGVDLEYSTDSGSSWTTIVTGTTDDGMYKWTVPDESSANCLVRGTIHDDQPSSGTDTSDSTFEIYDYPAEPQDVDIEYTGYSQTELISNGNFAGDYSGWTLTRPNNDGTSQYDGTETNSADGSGSINSFLDIAARNTDFVEDGVWNQSITPTSVQLTVNGAYKATINNVQGSINYNRATVEIDVYDTGPGSWQNVYSTGQMTTSTAWAEFGPDAAYSPSGEVTQVRVRLLTEISTGGGNPEPTAQCYAWADDISVEMPGVEGVDNRINWTASPDDGAGDDDVSRYLIYRLDMPNGPWDGSAILTNVTADDSTLYSYVDAGAGKGDATKWWYLIRAVDYEGRESTNKKAYREPNKVRFSFTTSARGPDDGWEFISLNLIPFNTDIRTILNDPINGISGSYDKVMGYDAERGEWMTYVPGRSDHYNDLDTWDQTIGIWTHMTRDDNLTVEGNPLSNTTLTLYPGWNMVSYPSNSTGNSNLPTEVTKVGYFNASAEYNIAYDYDPSKFTFEPFKAYWVYNGADYNVIWTVEY